MTKISESYKNCFLKILYTCIVCDSKYPQQMIKETTLVNMGKLPFTHFFVAKSTALY